MTVWRRKSVDLDGDDGPPFRVRDLLPAGILALLGLIALAVTTLSVGGVPGQYLVIAAPWHGREQVMDMVWRAGGGVAGFGGLSSVVVAMGAQPDFAAALRGQGAWIVLPSPRALGCFTMSDGGRP